MWHEITRNKFHYDASRARYEKVAIEVLKIIYQLIGFSEFSNKSGHEEFCA